jgi:transcriptional regulator with XRE-family HTH domain
MLQIMLKDRMKQFNLSSHTAAAEIGTSHTTILRILHGQPADTGTLIKIANWMKIRPSELLNSYSDTELADNLAAVMSHSPELEEVMRNIVADIKSEKLDPEILRDIASFATYTYSQRSKDAKRTGKGGRNSG